MLPNRSVFPRANGAAAERVRNHDWADTPLGASEQWPSALRSAVELMLNSPESMYLVWGSELIFLFNDAYTPILGPRLDRAMGAPLRELWADAWPAVKEPIEKAFRGEGSRFENLPIAMNRYGQHEDTWWTFSFSPLYAEGDGVTGAFCVTKEVTGLITAQERLARENERLIALFEKSPLFIAFLRGPDHCVELVNPGYSNLIGRREVTGRPIVEALPEVLDQGYLRLLDEVYRTGEPYIGSKVAYDSGIAESEGSPLHIVDVVFQPVRGDDGAVCGIFVQGLDITPPKWPLSGTCRSPRLGTVRSWTAHATTPSWPRTWMGTSRSGTAARQKRWGGARGKCWENTLTFSTWTKIAHPAGSSTT